MKNTSLCLGLLLLLLWAAFMAVVNSEFKEFLLHFVCLHESLHKVTHLICVDTIQRVITNGVFCCSSRWWSMSPLLPCVAAALGGRSPECSRQQWGHLSFNVAFFSFDPSSPIFISRLDVAIRLPHSSQLLFSVYLWSLYSFKSWTNTKAAVLIILAWTLSCWRYSGVLIAGGWSTLDYAHQ